MVRHGGSSYSKKSGKSGLFELANNGTALYTAKYQAYLANKMDNERNKTVTIAGKCCESDDILIWDLISMDVI